jgi:HEAT repeat protein
VNDRAVPAHDAHGSTVGIFTVDAQLVVRTWDGWMAASTGIPVDAALGRPIAAVLPESVDRGLLDLLRRVIELGTVEVLSPGLHRYLIACPPRTPSAAYDRMQQHVSIGPQRGDGRITGAVVTIEDVTARVERDRERAGDVAAMTHALGKAQWTERRDEVRRLATQGQSVVAALVQTLREQHHNFNVLSSALDLLALSDLDVIGPLIACLESDDVDLRIQTALILGERRDRRAIPALMRALSDTDENVRFHAIESLGRLRAAEAVDALVRIAEARDFFLAFPAIQALAKLGDATVARRLVPLLDDELLSSAVVDLLGELGDDVVVEPLAQLFDQPHAPVEAVADALASLHARYEHRYGAGDQIATLVRRTVSDAGTRALVEAVDRVSSDRLRGLACVLGWIRGTSAQRALARLLGQPAIRAQVVEALVRHGAGVVDLLVEQLQGDELEIRQAAAVALGRIGDRRATSALVEALEDDDIAVAAAGALARIGDASAFEALIRLVGDPDGAIRQATVAALNSIGHAEMPRHVRALLEDSNPLVRESAVRIAGYFGYDECFARVIDRCSDTSESVRRAAVEQLPMFDDVRAVERLTQALASDTPAVRAAAAAAFARVDGAAAVPALLAALEDADPWVRYFALRSLGAFHHAEAEGPVRERLEHDAAGQVRLAAIDVLGRLQPPGILTVLEPLAMSTDADEARAAIRAMRHVVDPLAQPALERLLQTTDDWRRAEAVSAIAQRGEPSAVATLEWTAAAAASAAVADAAIAGLASLASRDEACSPDATRALVALTAERARRESAISALSRLPVARAADVAAGLTHAVPAVRCAVVDALSRMRHTDATRWIETALNDHEASVRAAAVAELRRLGSRHAARKLVLMSQSDPDAAVRHAATIAAGGRTEGLTA